MMNLFRTLAPRRRREVRSPGSRRHPPCRPSRCAPGTGHRPAGLWRNRKRLYHLPPSIIPATFDFQLNMQFRLRYTFSLAMMIIDWIMIAFDYSPRAGEEREARGQNHCAPATGLAFWKGTLFYFSSNFFLYLLSIFMSFLSHSKSHVDILSSNNLFSWSILICFHSLIISYCVK